MSTEELVKEIGKLRKEKKAVILAHNYQRPEVQDIADYVGDSIELARRAMDEKEAKILVVAAVDFMAENAFLLNPTKKILIPSLYAHCPMARMLSLDDIRRYRKKYLRIPLVLYVNTFAEAKASCEVCCTSANAVKIVERVEGDTIIFGPDCNLAEYVQEKTKKKIIPIPEHGFCPTHSVFDIESIRLLKEQYPDAPVLVHPECSREVRHSANFVGSTSQIIRYAQEAKAKRYIIGTEEGILHRLRKDNPNKEFILASVLGICPNMKMNTLENIYKSLRDEVYPVTVPKGIATRARRALERMVELS
ncbi:MAG: quinolinate synthase [Thermoproteota archaeon]|nr:quinolinate synthase [Thermoproteota archaeon]